MSIRHTYVHRCMFTYVHRYIRPCKDTQHTFIQYMNLIHGYIAKQYRHAQPEIVFFAGCPGLANVFCDLCLTAFFGGKLKDTVPFPKYDLTSSGWDGWQYAQVWIYYGIEFDTLDCLSKRVQTAIPILYQHVTLVFSVSFRYSGNAAIMITGVWTSI